MSVKVRLRVRAGGEDHLTVWFDAAGVAEDMTDAQVVEAVQVDLGDRVLCEDGHPLPVRLGNDVHRLIAARAVDWVDVEVRRQ